MIGELVVLRCRMKSDEEAAVTFCDGTVLHRSQCDVGLGHDWTSAIIRLTTALRRPPTVDLSSLACLAALTLVTGHTYLHALTSPINHSITCCILEMVIIIIIIAFISGSIGHSITYTQDKQIFC